MVAACRARAAESVIFDLPGYGVIGALTALWWPVAAGSTGRRAALAAGWCRPGCTPGPGSGSTLFCAVVVSGRAVKEVAAALGWHGGPSR